MNDSVWTFEELSRDCGGHYCMADGKDYPALCRYEENMTSHPLGDVCGADCMGECSERFCPSEEIRRLVHKKEKAVRVRLRGRRLALHMTLDVCAKRAGLSKGYLSQVENGLAGIGLESSRRYADVLGVSMNEFVDLISSDNALRDLRGGSRVTGHADVGTERGEK